jgi:hypothetical protein
MKGKDVYRKKLVVQNFYGPVGNLDPDPLQWTYRDAPEERKYPDYGAWTNQMKAEKLKAKYSEFIEVRPRAAALLVELFGDTAFKVFAHFQFDKISESKCLDLLTMLCSIEEEEDENRALRAISNHIPGEIT